MNSNFNNNNTNNNNTTTTNNKNNNNKNNNNKNNMLCNSTPHCVGWLVGRLIGQSVGQSAGQLVPFLGSGLLGLKSAIPPETSNQASNQSSHACDWLSQALSTP